MPSRKGEGAEGSDVASPFDAELAAETPRQAGLTTTAHLAAVNLCLKSIPSSAVGIALAPPA